MATTQEVELLRRQLVELNAQMDEMRQQSTNAATNAAVTGLTEAVRIDRTVGVKTISREHESREARVVCTWQRR